MLKGKSRARAEGKFLQPPDKPEIPPVALEDEGQETTTRSKRHASVYDAVAGAKSILRHSIFASLYVQAESD
jgi:hypothetical protein